MRTERERMETFWMVRSEIRGSHDYLIVGIDVGKQQHHALVGTPTGDTLSEPLVFDNHRVGFEQLIARADALEVELDRSLIVFGLKPRGAYHKPLLEYLIRHDELAVLVSTVTGPPERLDERWAPEPAVALAGVVARVGQGEFAFAPAPEPNLEGLRQLLRTRAQLEQQAHGLAQRLRQRLMAQYFPELEWGDGAVGGAPDPVVLKVMRSCFDPAAIARMGFDELWHQLVEPSWGEREQARLLAVWQAAPASIGCVQSAAVGWEARRLVGEWESVQWQLAELDKLTGELAQWRPGYASLLTIPGVGPRVAAMIVAELGEPHRWTRRHQVLRRAGLDLRCPPTGPSRDRPAISRRGNAALRAGLMQAARVAVRCHPTIRAWFTKGLEGRGHERGPRRQREVQLAAKLLVVAWRLMQRGGSFDPDQFVR